MVTKMIHENRKPAVWKGTIIEVGDAEILNPQMIFPERSRSGAPIGLFGSGRQKYIRVQLSDETVVTGKCSVKTADGLKPGSRGYAVVRAGKLITWNYDRPKSVFFRYMLLKPLVIILMAALLFFCSLLWIRVSLFRSFFLADAAFLEVNCENERTIFSRDKDVFTKIRDVVDGAVYIRDFKKKANTEEYTSIRFVDNNRKILSEMEISRSGIVKIGNQIYRDVNGSDSGAKILYDYMDTKN